MVHASRATHTHVTITLLLHTNQVSENWMNKSRTLTLNIQKHFSLQSIFKCNSSSGRVVVLLCLYICSVYIIYDCYLIWDMSIERHQCFSVSFTHLWYFLLPVFVLSALQCSPYRSHLCLCPSTLSPLWAVTEKCIVVPSFPPSPQSKYLLTASESNTVLLLIFFYSIREGTAAEPILISWITFSLPLISVHNVSAFLWLPSIYILPT